MSKDKVISQIRKLLNIAKDDNAFDGEIETCMAMAQKRMERHHLTEEDLAHKPEDDFKKVDEAYYSQCKSWICARVHAWEDRLAGFVSKFVGVPCYIEQEKDWARDRRGLLRRWQGEPWQGKAVVFYGVAEDAQIAAELYDELWMLICTIQRFRWERSVRGVFRIFERCQRREEHRRGGDKGEEARKLSWVHCGSQLSVLYLRGVYHARS